MQFGRIHAGTTVADYFASFTIPAGTVAGTHLSRERASFAWSATAAETDAVVRLRDSDLLICQSPQCLDGYGAPADGGFLPYAILHYENVDRLGF